MNLRRISDKTKGIIPLLIVISGGSLRADQKEKFAQYFRKTGEIVLETKNRSIGGLREINVSPAGDFVFVDAKGRQVLVFGADGAFKKSIGKTGQGPGEFLVPSTSTFDPNGNIYVADGRMRRVNKFDRTGQFMTSFIIMAQQGQPSAIRVDSKSRIYLDGLGLPSQNGKRGCWINRYDPRGVFTNSFYEDETDADWIVSMYPRFAFDVDQEKIYAAQIQKYQVAVFSPEGRLLARIGNPPPYFVPPDEKFRFNETKAQSQQELVKILTRLSNSWTRIVKIAVIQSRYLLIVSAANGLVRGCSSPFIVDLWSISGKPVALEIPVDFPFLCSGPNGDLYFLLETDEDSAIDKDASYRIGRFQLTVQ